VNVGKLAILLKKSDRLSVAKLRSNDQLPVGILIHQFGLQDLILPSERNKPSRADFFNRIFAKLDSLGLPVKLFPKTP
jgi:hypothetical protein